MPVLSFREAKCKERVVKFSTMNGPVQTQLFYCCAVKMCLSKARWWDQTEGERYMVLLVIVAQNGEWPCLLFGGVTGVLRQLKCLFVSAFKLQRWLPCFFQPPGADATHCFFFTYQTALFIRETFLMIYIYFYFLPLRISWKYVDHDKKKKEMFK